MNIPTTSIFSNYTAMSTNLWFKADVKDVDQGLIWKTNNTTYSIGMRMTSANKLQGVVAPASGETYITGGTTLTTGVWYMATLTYDGANIRLYLNGSSDAAAVALTGNTRTSTDALYIGAQGGNTFFDGIIDEVGAWSRELSSTEVTALYNSGNGNQYPFTTSSSAFFNFF